LKKITSYEVADIWNAVTAVQKRKLLKLPDFYNMKLSDSQFRIEHEILDATNEELFVKFTHDP
jgi:hypothetical protein